MATWEEPSRGIDRLLQAHQYLDSQPWVLLSLTDEGVLEIIVDTELIHLTDAKERILHKTLLCTDEFTISSMVAGHHLSIENEDVHTNSNTEDGQQRIYFEKRLPEGKTELTACSFSGVLYNRCNTAVKYLITSGHYTTKGTKYYLDAELKVYLGVCTHCCFQCVESGEFVDMALVKIEKEVLRNQLGQLIHLPSAATGLETFAPQLYKEQIQDFENSYLPLYKHGRALIRGRFALIRQSGAKYLALISEQWRSGTCFRGESGSPITAQPGSLDCQGALIRGLGVVAGLQTIQRKSEDGEDLDTPVCVFSSIWTGLKFFGLEDLKNIEFCPPFNFGGASTEDQDSGCKSQEETLDVSSIKLDKYPRLKKLMADHCRSRHYSFQIKKCAEEDCAYCHMLNPPRLPPEEFAELRFLPDPVLNEAGEYKNLDAVYGKETTDADRPSLKHAPQATETDKANKKLFVAAKVRGFITCHECGKRRVVYSEKKLSVRELTVLLRADEEVYFTCSSTLLAEGQQAGKIVVKMSLRSSSSLLFAPTAGTLRWWMRPMMSWRS